MRRVRRRRGSRRLAKGKKDWVVGPWTTDRDQPLGQTGTQFYTLIDGAELEEKDDRLTVLRIVGDVWTVPVRTATGLADGGGKYWYGIKVFETDNTGALLPVFPLDGVDADANWMFLRVGFTSWEPNTDGGGVTRCRYTESHHGYANSGWAGAHIDVQVKRRLQDNEVLILAAGMQVELPYTSGLSTNFTCEHNIFVRTLVGNL